MSGQRPYVRSLPANWWTAHPFFVKYMIREASSVPIAVYSVILIVGLGRLAQGSAAWASWRDVLQHPAAIALHIVALALILYHCYTWIRIAPKVLPDMWLQNRLHAPGVLTAVSWAINVVVWGAFLLLVAGAAGS